MQKTGQERIVVVGLGNYLLSDDGIGVHALPEIARAAPAGVETLDIGTAVWHLAGLLDGARRVLVIDAMQAGGAPGTVYRLEDSDALASWQRPSAHGIGFAEVMQWMPAERQRPKVTVLGVEPGSLDCSTELSPAVREALPRVVAEARRILTDWMVSTNA